MKRFSEQFKKKSDSIRLRASERNDLRDRLTAYMEYHPLPAELKTAKQATASRHSVGLVSEPFKAISVNMTYLRSFAGVFTICMIVGVPLIAEKAVPGDMLYSVKTNITEEVRASLTLSPYAKVEWETARLERRVAEARLLATEGKLTPEVEADVAQAVQEHTVAAQEGIASMRETDEDEAAMAEIAFASAMDVQSEVLERHIAKDPDSVDSVQKGQSIVVLAGIVNGVRDHAAVAQAGSRPSYEKLLANIESQTTRAYELFESVKKHAGPEETLNIERRLADIGRKVEEAITLHAYQSEAPVEQETAEEDVVASEEVTTEEVSTNVTEEVVPEVVDALEDGAVVPVEDVLEVPAVEAVEVKEVVRTEEEQKARAITLLRAALTDVQKLIIFMTDIDVRENVTIEELVPVTLTTEERTKTILTQLDQVLLMQVEIESHILAGPLTEKVLLGNKILATQIVLLTQMLEVGDIAGAERVVAEAYAMARDLGTLVADLPRRGDEENVVVEEIEGVVDGEILDETDGSIELE